MRFRLIGRAFPSEALGEDASLGAEALDQLARFGNALHGRGHRAHIAVRHEESRVAVAHGLANARRVGGDDGRGAGGGFEIGDAPTLLWRREDQRPRAAQKRELVRLTDSPKKPYAVAEVKRVRELFE